MTRQLNAGFPYSKLYPFVIHATEHQTGMMVFLYCTEQLKDEPLFSEHEVMNDDEVGNEGYDSDEGAKYNNYDSQPPKLLRTDTSFCRSDTDFTHGDAVEASMVPEDMLEKVSLNLDQRIPERWTKSHGLSVNEGDINSEKYHEKVLLTALGKWRKMDLEGEDSERFDRSRRNNWSGVDLVYDAYIYDVEKIIGISLTMIYFSNDTQAGLRLGNIDMGQMVFSRNKVTVLMKLITVKNP